MSPVLIWKPDPDIVLYGNIAISWYGLLFGLGFLAGRQIFVAMTRHEGKTGLDVDGLLISVILGTVAGARLGHCLVYEPAFYLAHPLEMLKIWKGGLASHGAVVGVLAAVAVFSMHSGDRYLWIVDRIAMVALLAGALVRVGNFANSEMLGVPTNGGYGVVFARDVEIALQRHVAQIDRVDVRKDDAPAGSGTVPIAVDIWLKPGDWSETNLRGLEEGEIQFLLRNDPKILPHIVSPAGTVIRYDLVSGDGPQHIVIHAQALARHPAQLYEAICYVSIGGILFLMWLKKGGGLVEGWLAGVFLVSVFSSRFLIEFIKVDQVPAEIGLPLNYGQLLSIPFVVAGVGLIVRARFGRFNHPIAN